MPGAATFQPPQPLYYTFGNHMHWVDMQWLWGYGVLPGSVADMLHLCREAGARGNVNFDAVGYEKLAGEAPESLADLRSAVAAGTIEPVGCSYGQPYGLFQPGESNVRQLVFGVRATTRLLGARPRTFWEEEFYCFPQLAQMLRGTGFTGACLFFQWTWHTPELPREACSLVEWVGIEGSRLPALPRNGLNLHQWPEDFDGLLESDAITRRPAAAGPAAIVQWLELMPSRDWMCRSEVLLPRLRALMSDARFEIRPRTAGQLIAELCAAAKADGRAVPDLAISPDDVWHGMTLGKNADAHPRASRRAEAAILAAESASALASLLGRPYASWDVYPSWELDEAWREALAAQHHDNHECEGLCGFVGHGQFDKARQIAAEVASRATWLLARRAGAPDTAGVVFNQLGWPRQVRAANGAILEVPPFGYARADVAPSGSTDAEPAKASLADGGNLIVLGRGPLRVEVDAATGAVGQIALAKGSGACGEGAALFTFAMRHGGDPVPFASPELTFGDGASVTAARSADRLPPVVRARFAVPGGSVISTYTLPEGLDVLDVHVQFEADVVGRPVKPDAGLNAALQAVLRPGFAFTTFVDSPYAVHEVHGGAMTCRRKYPTADWMTSPQWFETVERPFTATSFVDLVRQDGGGLLIAHDGSQQWFRDEAGLRVILTAYDPWDEGRYSGDGFAGCRFRLIPHTGLTHDQRVQRANQFAAEVTSPPVSHQAEPVGGGTAYGVERDLPRAFGAIEVSGAPGVLAHAFYRESAYAGEHLPDWAGHRMAAESGGECTHPFVLRLVEWNGEPAEVTLKLPGRIALAAKTNLMGEVGPQVAAGADTAWLEVEPAVPPAWAMPATAEAQAPKWSQVRFRMRPREIATVMFDAVAGRKKFRDLDAKRDVWATVHKE